MSKKSDDKKSAERKGQGTPSFKAGSVAPTVKTSVAGPSTDGGTSKSKALKLTVELEAVRKRLRDLDIECRAKTAEDAKCNEQTITEKVDKLRQAHLIEVEQAVTELKQQFQKQIESSHAELELQQEAELEQLTGDNSGESAAEKQAIIEQEMKQKDEETESDIAEYRRKREALRDEAIQHLQDQCKRDIEEYSKRRREGSNIIMDQLRQRLDLELKNDALKDQLNVALKVDQSKERYVKARTNATEQLNRAMAKAIADLRSSKEAELDARIAELKTKAKEIVDLNRKQVEDQYSEERTRLVASIEQMEISIKKAYGEDQRELERRIKKKKELLIMLAQQDTRKLPDEDLITKHKFHIDRAKIVYQSSASTIYVASSGESTCYCKVTMIKKWSVRHRVDFFKYGARLARYLSALGNAPFFAKIIDVLATDTKVYTFMEPFSSTRTLHSFLFEFCYSKCKKNAKDSSGHVTYHSGLKRAELVNVLTQLSKAVHFLDNLFVAHTALNHSNITIVPADASDLSTVKLLITGLTRPIVYYSVEEDRLITVRGFDTSVDPTLDPIDNLPPECFDGNFLASQVDVYSIGVLAYSLLRLRSPFSKDQVKVVAAKKTSSVRLSLANEEAEHENLPSLVAALTHPQQNKRPAVEDIFSFRYMKLTS